MNIFGYNLIFIINKKTIKRFVPYLLIALFFGFLLIVFGRFLINRNQRINQSQLNTHFAAPTEYTFTSQPKTAMWLLNKKENGSSRTVLSICGDCYGSYILQWEDWLFYTTTLDNSVQINEYNFKSEKLDTLYDLRQHTKEFEGRGKGFPSELADIKIIDRTLYFSLGGYLAPGAIFWMDLPPASKPQKLTDSSNGVVAYWKNRYWVVGGEGDACGGFMDYSLVDLIQKKVTHIASSTVGCFDGEGYIEIDKRDRMIMAFHTTGTGDGGDNDSGIYKYVIAIPLDNPAIKEGVIAKQNMPAEITDIRYSKDADQLFLYGKQKYIFDFLSNSIQKVDELPSVPEESLLWKVNKTLSEMIKEIKLPYYYEFVLE